MKWLGVCCSLPFGSFRSHTFFWLGPATNHQYPQICLLQQGKAKSRALPVCLDLARLVSLPSDESVIPIEIFEGVAELLVFHPVDTIAKRLMSNKNKVKFWLEREVNLLTISQVTFSSLSSILFREHASAGLGRKLLSLFPGLGYAAGYKVSQRIYKFGGQPWFNDLLVGRYKTQFTNTFGERRGRMVMQATAGR